MRDAVFLSLVCEFIVLWFNIFDYTRLGKLEVNKWHRTANENAAGIRRIRYSLILRLVALYWEVIYVFVTFLFSIYSMI